MAARSAAADIVYRALLYLYPASFQEEFGSDMALDFADASDEAWIERGWAGLAGVWAVAVVDLARSLPAQWVRTRMPVFALVGMVAALTSTVAAVSLVPDEPLFAHVTPRDRDLILLILLTACVLIVIAATIMLNVCFLRPLIHRGRARQVVRSGLSLRI